MCLRCALRRNWVLCHDKHDVGHTAEHLGSPARKVSPKAARRENLRNLMTEDMQKSSLD